METFVGRSFISRSAAFRSLVSSPSLDPQVKERMTNAIALMDQFAPAAPVERERLQKKIYDEVCHLLGCIDRHQHRQATAVL